MIVAYLGTHQHATARASIITTVLDTCLTAGISITLAFPSNIHKFVSSIKNNLSSKTGSCRKVKNLNGQHEAEILPEAIYE